MDVVRIHDGVRARNNHGVRRKLGNTAAHLVVRGDGGGYLILARTHPRDDERRVRNGKCSNDTHGRDLLGSLPESIPVAAGYTFRFRRPGMGWRHALPDAWSL